MPKKGTKAEKVFNTPELKVKFQCALHPWMYAYVHVLEHPFFAVTRKDGSFTIKGLPPGKYEVSVLHEVARMKPVAARMSVRVEAGQKIGLSGNTGHTALPHLHFAVYKATWRALAQSVPVNFISANGVIFKPRRGQRYLAVPSQKAGD